MKNITEKIETLRIATAESRIRIQPNIIERLKNNDVPKKDILPISRAAAVMAAKNTPQTIPYCHPLPLDNVDVDYKVLENEIIVTVTTSAIWKTGVEMEALVAASAATLNIYDMLKPLDTEMEILSTKLLSKTGGKTSFKEHIPKDFKAAVIVTSDGTHKGTREDNSGKIIKEHLQGLAIENCDYVILPDEQNQIRNELLKFSEQGYHLVITTGGTGMGPRDVTVEATKDVITKELPAVVNAMQSYGQKRTPYAMLSRALAGSRDGTIIVNLPGSSRGAKECMNAIFPALLHVYKMMKGGGH